MITEEELGSLLDEAASAIAVPERGPEAIITAAMPPAVPRRPRWSLRPREFAFAGTGLAALIALVVVLLTSGGGSVPVFPASGFKAAAAPATASGAPAVVTPGAQSRTVAPSKAAAVAIGRDIVTTGTLHLGVSKVDLSGSVDKLESLAVGLGGYVGQASVAETGANPGGNLVLEVPAASFSTLVERARSAGKVRSLSESDQDVTSQVVDLGARLTALVEERNQLEALLARAGKVSDLLAVENQIEVVQSEIEQIQGEQRVLSQQVSYSALTVDLVVPPPPRGSTTGFAHAWHSAVTGFVNGVKAFVSDLGDIALALLALVIGLVLLLFVWRRVWPLVRRRLA